MAAVTLLEQFEVVPNSAIKTILFTLANTVDATDTLAITLSDHGISATGLLTVNGWVHTTDGSVITTEAVTSSVVAGVLTVTIPAGTDNDFRVIEIRGRGDPGDFA